VRWVESNSVTPSDQRLMHTRSSIAWPSVLCDVLDGVAAVHVLENVKSTWRFAWHGLGRRRG